MAEPWLRRQATSSSSVILTEAELCLSQAVFLPYDPIQSCRLVCSDSANFSQLLLRHAVRWREVSVYRSLSDFQTWATSALSLVGHTKAMVRH
jgi:hypothetical protein